MATAQSRGWGPPCRVPLVTLVRADGLRLPVHRDVADLVSMLIDLTELQGYDVKPGQTWGYACRKISGTNVDSEHSWALPVDINAPANPYASAEWHRRNARGTFPFGLQVVCDIPESVLALWEAYGFRLGVKYRTKPDPMHQEFYDTPAAAARYTLALRKWIADNGEAPAPEPIPVPPLDPDEEDDMRPRTIHANVSPDDLTYSINLPPWDRPADYNYRRCVVSFCSDPGALRAGSDPAAHAMHVRLAFLSANGERLGVIHEDITNVDQAKGRGHNPAPTIDVPAGTRQLAISNNGPVPVGVCVEMFPA